MIILVSLGVACFSLLCVLAYKLRTYEYEAEELRLAREQELKILSAKYEQERHLKITRESELAAQLKDTLAEISFHRDHLVNTNAHIRERVAVLEAALKNFLTQATDLLRLEAAAKQKVQAELYEKGLRK